MIIKTIIRIVKELINRIRRMHELRKYDDYNIADYFRKLGASIGENNRIMLRSLGDDPYLIKIGNHCSISSGVRLITHDGGGWIFTDEIPSLQRFGMIEIKDNCYIGVDCIVLPGVTIGPNVVVGAGSVVTKDVPPNTVVAGNPARVIKSIESYREKITQQWEQQRPAGYLSELRENTIYSPEHILKLKIKQDNREKLKKHLMKLFEIE